MIRLRALVPILLTAAAAVVFAGVSAALEGDDPPAAPSGTIVEDTGACPHEPAELDATDGTGVGLDATDVEGDDDCEAADPPQGDEQDDELLDDESSGDSPADSAPPADHPDNHGAVVSAAAHDCPPGPDHGPCVSEVARGTAGKPSTGDGEDPDDSSEPEAQGAAGAAHGHGQGQGRGHAKGHHGPSEG